MAKGMLCRRQALSDAGNFTRILNVAADDFLLAKYIKDAGWKLFLSDVPAYVVHQSWPWKLLYARHIRHGALRWRLCAWAYPLEVLYNPIVCALPALALMESWGAVIFLAAVILKIALEIATATALRRTPIRLRYLPLIPIKDLLFFGIWWHALMEKKVTWRKINYRMTRGSRLIRIDPPVDPKRSAVPSAQTVCRWMPGPE